MKVYTSYYAVSGRNPRAKAISNSVPAGLDIPKIAPLVPPWEIVQRFKVDGDGQAYTDVYEKQLDRIGIDKMSALLHDGDVLLCYEAPGKFCHRHILAKWLNNHGIDAEELEV